jgi:hypothetical protein
MIGFTKWDNPYRACADIHRARKIVAYGGYANTLRPPWGLGGLGDAGDGSLIMFPHPDCPVAPPPGLGVFDVGRAWRF